jgi:GntR family transcriptional regulator
VTVDQRDPTPLYQQLAAILRAQIKSGQLADKLPSESYLQQEHGVSRGTVRRAIEILTAEGLVYTIGARGTFIR